METIEDLILPVGKGNQKGMFHFITSTFRLKLVLLSAESHICLKSFVFYLEIFIFFLQFFLARTATFTKRYHCFVAIVFII